jgi:hypothetical protein
MTVRRMRKRLLAILAGGFMSSAAADPSAFIQGALEGLQQQTSAHSATWHLGEESDWAADLEAGTLTFTFADGTKATAPIQVIGTYNSRDGTFLWGWDHPSVPDELRLHSELARKWGVENAQPKYTARKVSCSEEEAWEFTAVAARLAKANGAYRGPSGTTFVFMTFGQVQLSKGKG